MRTTAAALALGVAMALAAACTDAGLQENPREEVDFVDNLLDLHGEYCTSPAEELEFPVKILVVMDQSASLQCTDQDYLRRTAVSNLVNDLRGNPAVSFGYIGFHAAIYRVGFTTADEFMGAMSEAIIQLGPATDYQGVLSTVVQTLEQDLINSPMSLRARTKYVVLFVSDGVPEPRCDAGCEDDNSACDDGEDNDGDGLVDGGDPDCADTSPDRLYGICNASDEDLEELADDEYVDMRSICPEYNMEYQILRRVDDIMALADAYGVGDLRFHTVFLFASQEVVDARCGGSGAAFGYVRDEAMPLLQSMADAGEGTFREVNVATDREGNFLRVDYQPLESTFDLMETLAVNTNSMATPLGPVTDTDGDGIEDDAEFDGSLDRFMSDTDNDGWSDLFELRNDAAGFDALDGNRPRACCPEFGLAGTCCSAPFVCACPTPPMSADAELTDRDGDGLNAAEERFIGTDERDPDTDGDRLPDGLEFRLGLDPTEPDALADHDFDGIRTRDEVRAATDPQLPDASREAARGVRYRVEDIGQDSSHRRCYEFDVNNIELVTTLQQPGADGEGDPVTQGRNRIYLMMVEEPVELAGHRGNLFLGCVEATYLGDTFKDPPDGLVDLTQVRDACYRTCLACDERESVTECQDRCRRQNRDNPAACTRCDEPCNLFHESEVFDPEVHCVSSLCVYPDVWGEMVVGGTMHFMCRDNCVVDGYCNCLCSIDCDCNPYRSERCATARVCE